MENKPDTAEPGSLPPPHDKHQMEKEAQRVILICGKDEGPALPQGGSLMIT